MNPRLAVVVEAGRGRGGLRAAWLAVAGVGLVLLAGPLLPRWIWMWVLAGALFQAGKVFTFERACRRGEHFTRRGVAGFFLGWVGMDPEPFAVEACRADPPRRAAWARGAGWLGLGAAVVFAGVRHLPADWALLRGWAGMVGICWMLHFGSFELLALGWRRAGVPVMPLMQRPVASVSLAEFWGRRWNTGFHHLAVLLVFRPLARRWGVRPAQLATFLASGLVHELVITVPAGGGYGLPTAYFLLQALGALTERARFGRGVGLGRGVRGWMWCALVAGVPAVALFPPIFIERVILPLLRAIGAL